MIDPLLFVKPRATFGDHAPAKFAHLSTGDTPLARAIRQAQRYFTDHDLIAAIEGRSKTILLTMIDDQPVFLNAAMIADVMTGFDIASDQDIN